MAAPRRSRFYLGVLTVGFLAGALTTALLEQFLPESATKEFFTFAVTPTFGPVSLDLLVVSFTLGPVALNVSILSLVGVVAAYYAARSLF